jgi:hypothetical protein
MEDWRRAHAEIPGRDRSEYSGLIGISDPDAAFWFRMRWA